jgi:predicted aspartyl protease
MPILTLPLEPDGAVINIGFVVSGPRQDAMRKAGVPIPAPVVVRGLVDTGASGTCVDCTVIKKLQLVPSGTISIHTPSTGPNPKTCNQFDVGVGIVMDNNQIHLSGLVIPVIESDLSALNIQALLGRDLLEQGILIYDGRRRLLTLAF